MRIVIDIEGDEVKVHRMDGDELPPADVLLKAAAVNAQSAGIAKFRRPELFGEIAVVASPEDLRVVATDAGRGPSGPPRGRRTARLARRPRASRKVGRSLKGRRA